MAATNVVFKNGFSAPSLGFGTWRTPPEIVGQAIKDAIDVGYRHFDCAFIYGNEPEIGVAFEAKICEGKVKRSDLFITSKLWLTFLQPKLVRGACETSIQNLRIEYLDNYLMHFPMAFQEGKDLHPKDEIGNLMFSKVDYIDTWRAMEALVDAGLCRSIGISNFNKRQLLRLLAHARIKPANLQIECHPYLTQRRLMALCKEHSIIVTAYSALGSQHSPYEKPGPYPVLEHPKILEISRDHERSPAQILLRYQVQRGNIVLARSINKKHMAINFKIYDFKLSDEDMCEIDSLDMNGRFNVMAIAYGHPEHPFENDEW